jgi:hypothetical protein
VSVADNNICKNNRPRSLQSDHFIQFPLVRDDLSNPNTDSTTFEMKRQRKRDSPNDDDVELASLHSNGSNLDLPDEVDHDDDDRRHARSRGGGTLLICFGMAALVLLLLGFTYWYAMDTDGAAIDETGNGGGGGGNKQPAPTKAAPTKELSEADIQRLSRGVNPIDMSSYVSTDPYFACLRTPGLMIARSRVNDDFCDCPDGSDEPGTNACPGPKTRFFCAGERMLLTSSFVNDGICGKFSFKSD